MNKLKVLICLFTTVLLMTTCKQDLSEFFVYSPDKNVKINFYNENGSIYYELDWYGKKMIHKSKLSIFDESQVEITDIKRQTINNEWEPVWGQFSLIEDKYNELIIQLDINHTIGNLIVRAYDEGVGFRYKLNGIPDEQKTTFFTEFNLDSLDKYYSYAPEDEPLGPFSAAELLNNPSSLPQLRIPIVVEKPGNKYMAILESDLYSAEGFDLMKVKFEPEKSLLISENSLLTKVSEIISPWRTILLGDTPGDLVVNTVPINLADTCKISDPSWVDPGKTLWDWRVHGYTTKDNFTYGINNESYYRFIDFASEKKIEYFLIDAGWFTSASGGHFEIKENLDLKEVHSYATDKGVELLLYYDRHKGNYGDEELFSFFNSLGMKGIKYGFMGENVEFTRDAINTSAQTELLINFHDRPVPLTGVRRTMPNAVTREYCHAQQDARRAFTPRAFIKMALINAIQGPLDMNNGNFDIEGINKGEREKGPRKIDSYHTTVVSEAARTLIIFSGLVCLPDAPKAYKEKADLFEFIINQPVGHWDESRIINSQIGKYITTARRHNDQWFIGSVINEDGGKLNIKLDFLEPGNDYEVTYYEDTSETHYINNPETYMVRKGTVRKDDVVVARMAKGGGHCMWIRKKN